MSGLFVHPLLLGAGRPLFGDLPAPRSLRMTRIATTSKGTIAVTSGVDGRRE